MGIYETVTKNCLLVFLTGYVSTGDTCILVMQVKWLDMLFIASLSKNLYSLPILKGWIVLQVYT